MAHDIRVYRRGRSIVFCRVAEEWGWLSNMASEYPLYVLGGLRVATVESLYQALRFPLYPAIQDRILHEPNPMRANAMARESIALTRPDWESVKIRGMRYCLEVKTVCNPDFADRLKRTGSSPIVALSEKDSFWGATPQENGTLQGVNALGRLLMGIRQHLHAVGPLWQPRVTFPDPLLLGLSLIETPPPPVEDELTAEQPAESPDQLRLEWPGENGETSA